jgi:cytochrome c biogenesis protein
VDDSWREDYPSGEPKQWFTHASVIGERGNVIRQETICVNAPMSFDGFDVYQAAWGPHKANLSFNGHKQSVVLRPMGNTNVGVLPVAPRVLLVLSVKRRDMPMDVYVKTGANRAPQMVASLNVGDEFKMGAVSMRYEQFVPSTHLKYKHDPGVPVVYLGFALITCGVCMAAFEKSSKALEANVV